MKDPKLARRYAQALYSAAVQMGEVEAVMEAVRDILVPLLDDPQFRLFWLSGFVPAPRQRELVDEAFKDVPASLRHFLKLLIEKRREGILAEVVPMLGSIHDEATDVVRATLTTALELNDEEAKPFEVMLKKRLGGGTIVLTRRVDPSLIGGFRLRYGDKVIDGSIARSIDEIERRLTA
ncbi:MAG: ATP synthase F1 subunit delta [bacterium]